MAKPVVAIVGRPNVGKSTFFNYLSGKRISIIEDSPGVTRDRIYADVEWRSRSFTLVDTGGIEPFASDPIMRQMKCQAQIAINTADVVLFMTDAKDGLIPADEEVANLLRVCGKPVITVVNKADRAGAMEQDAFEFYALSLGEVMTVSSLQGLGMGDLLDAIYDYLPKELWDDVDDGAIKVALIGKPNVGKSSLINRILGEERVITGELPGTTRDAIDAAYTDGDDKYIFIDTAGIRRKSKVNEAIERYSVMRAITAVERADVCLIMIDAAEGVSEQDTKIAGYAHDAGKSTIIIVNKWDLVEKDDKTMASFKLSVYETLSFLRYSPVLFVSAFTGQRVKNIFAMIRKVHKNASFRAPTGLLNDVLNEAIATTQPPSDKGRRLKIYYMTQIGVCPPTFVIFLNNAELMHYSYSRYIENTLRQAFDFDGTPIRLINRVRDERNSGVR